MWRTEHSTHITAGTGPLTESNTIAAELLGSSGCGLRTPGSLTLCALCPDVLWATMRTVPSVRRWLVQSTNYQNKIGGRYGNNGDRK